MLKQLALRIAVLAETDRTWLLSQLSQAEQLKLQPLLEEAISLGLNRDPSVLEMLSLIGEQEDRHISSTAHYAQLIAQLPTFWRQVLGENLVAEPGQFLLGQMQTEAPALRKCVIELAIAAHESTHV